MLTDTAMDQSQSIMTPQGAELLLPNAPIPADRDQISDVVREAPELSPARATLVKEWVDKVVNAKLHWSRDFQRMKENLRFASGTQWGSALDEDRYVANITQRHLQQKVASLYAKNPTIVCKMKKRMDYMLWDENLSTLGIVQQQIQVAQQTGMLPPETQQFIQDFSNGTQTRQHLKKIARTLEILFEHTLDTQEPPFKLNMKQLVRRTLATGVGYVKLGFKRTLKQRPEDVAHVNVLTEAIANATRISNDRVDDELTDESPELETLRLQLKQAEENTQNMIDFEGLTFDFPSSTSIIIDPLCRHLRTFTGAQWIAHEFILHRDQIQEIYGIDIKGAQTMDGIVSVTPTDKDGHQVWEVYDKKTGQTFTIMQGYADYLREPDSPDFHLNRFWPVFPLCFNELEVDGTATNTIYPVSDVTLLRPIQKEYNRSREALRRHRQANRPRHATGAGGLSETDKNNLSSAEGNSVIEIQTLMPGEDIRQKLMPIPLIPLDPQVYNTDVLYSDMQRVVGQAEANLGGTSGGATATESSIAESSRSTAIASNVDDLDDLLRQIASEGGQVLLSQMSKETVMQIVGQGAVWPESDTQAVSDALGLDIQAGSSGRPNKAMDIQNFERLLPYFMQIPGIKPEWVAREAVRRLDDSLDFADAWIENVPSMIAQNSMTQLAAKGAGPQNPSEQGNKGGQNAPVAPASQAGGPPQMGPTQTPPPQAQ